MICFQTYIDEKTIIFLKRKFKKISSFNEANDCLEEVCGIINFFNAKEEFIQLKRKLEDHLTTIEDSDRREYGDFQTNEELARRITKYLHSKGISPRFILEPTCGKGNFILACLKQFNTIKKVVGVEIYQPYVWETKFKILNFFIQNPNKQKPDIDIFHANAFEFLYDEIASQTQHLETLVIGNPPWVTNAELSSLNSKNLPKKSNFKKHSGFDAITGKGNFDIGEYISLLILNNFNQHNGYFAFLIKNSVVKNIVQDQRKNQYRIAQSEKLNIDSKKEFNVSVNASLFLTALNKEPDFTCKELDFYSLQELTVFGWYKNKFVYSISGYDQASVVDGKSCFIWRSGLKHDCSKIMELERLNSHYLNGLKKEVKIENDLVFGLLKSSDLKELTTNCYRKLTIVTQKKIGQETNYIKRDFPLTFEYLSKNKAFFDKRKSSIYKDKPDFSIFGVGDYSFALYKIAISGMYKTTHFTLVLPENGKPIMLDDTCYFIGFDNLKYAKITHQLVNTDIVQQFLKSIIFSDSKRSINKDILMRIDFEKIYEMADFNLIRNSIADLTLDDWNKFGELLTHKTVNKQFTLF